MKKRVGFVLLVVILMALLLSACASEDQSSGYNQGYSSSNGANSDQSVSTSNENGKITRMVCYQMGQKIVEVTSPTGIELTYLDIPGNITGYQEVWQWQDEFGISHALMYSESMPCHLYFSN